MAATEMAAQAPLWAVANEARHWNATEVARLKGDYTALPSLLRVPRGHQGRLQPSPARGDEPLQRRSRPPLDARDLERRLEEARREIEAMRLTGISCVPLYSSGYPARLADIPDPPLVLYSLGALGAFDRCVAVSGTRTPSAWGARTAERLGLRLAKEGWVVTSGLARGVDTRAHQGALSAPGGLTVAVSALPLDRVYPAENLELARRIVDRGAVVSEHALSGGDGKLEFLRRNRIISGLAFAHFIVETSGEGGTWAQAKTAKAQGRPVLALRPPRTEERAGRGFEALLALGATRCNSVEDAVRETAALWAAELA